MKGRMSMHLKALEYLVEIVNCGSINDASKNLFVSQPTLSLAIADMEEELHTKLLHRTSKGVVPTNMGYKIYLDAINLIQQTEKYLETWKDEITLSQNISGEVKILCIPSASTLISRFVIRELQECSPQIHLRVYEDRVTNELVFLNECDFQLIIGSYKTNQQDTFYQAIPPDWHVAPLFEDRISVLISPKNPLSRKPSLSISDCETLSLAFYYYGELEAPPVYLPLFKHGSHQRFTSREAIMQAVAENIAVGIFPQKITQHDFYQKSNLITSVLFEESAELPTIMHYIAYRNELSAAERKVLDTIRYCVRTYYE